MINPDIFRAYDIRGLVGDDLHPDSVALIARGFAKVLRDRGGRRVVLGRDARTSSELFAGIFSRQLNDCGVSVVDIGQVPTPLTYFAAHALEGIDGLAMVTGSHNPPAYNGFKLGVGQTTFDGDEIQHLRSVVEAGDFPTGHANTRQEDVFDRYFDHVHSHLKMGPRKLRVVVDAGNGVGGLVARRLYEALGVEFIGMYLDPDGTFPNHHADPSQEENVEELRRKVTAEKADLGIAYDGDADRLTVIDEKGDILWGDQLMLLFSRAVLRGHRGATVVGEVKCSQVMFDEIERQGGVPLMWKAGHSWIKAKMRETRAVLGGEMSGHIFFADRWFGFDDGPYAGARLLEILSHEDRPLSELIAAFPKTWSSPEVRRDAGTEERKFKLVNEATRHFRKLGQKVVDVDGARISFPGGWGLVRASNTQPILILRYEANSPEALEAIRSEMEQTLERIERRIG